MRFKEYYLDTIRNYFDNYSKLYKHKIWGLIQTFQPVLFTTNNQRLCHVYMYFLIFDFCFILVQQALLIHILNVFWFFVFCYVIWIEFCRTMFFVYVERAVPAHIWDVFSLFFLSDLDTVLDDGWKTRFSSFFTKVERAVSVHIWDVLCFCVLFFNDLDRIFYDCWTSCFSSYLWWFLFLFF